MTIQEGLYTYLAAQSAITALTSTRIYPIIRPQNTALPAITYQRISSSHEHHLSAGSLQSSDLHQVRMQVDCYATTYKGAETLAKLVEAALDAYRGTMGTVNVLGVFLDSSTDMVERADDGSDPGEFRISTDYRINFRE